MPGTRKANGKPFLSPLAAVFLALIASGGLLFAALPKQTFSEDEKRKLRRPPAFSLSSLKDGSFASGVESYMADHFPARLQLVGLDAYFTLLCGRNGANGVYAGRDGCLFGAPVSAGGAGYRQNLSAIASFSARQNVPASLMAVPTAGAVERQKLPAVHAPYPDAGLLRQAKRATAGRVGWIDLSSAFQNAGEPLYYRTDHHWTSAGAYRAYRAFCAARKLSPVPASRFSVRSVPGFYGTAYSKSGLWATPPDTLSVWIDRSMRVSVTIRDDGRPGAVRSDSMFFWGRLAHPDKYPVFLDGNHSLVTIENPSAPARRLLIVKDSYADSLAPFLAAHYRRIDLIDLRYFHRRTVSSLAETNRFDEILFVYGLDSLVSDRNLSMLE